MPASQIKTLSETGFDLIKAELENIKETFISPKTFARESKIILDRILQELKKLKKEFNVQTHIETLILVSKIDPELEVKSIKDAEWELNIDYSQQGRERIYSFLAEQEKVEADLARVYDMQLKRDLVIYEEHHLPKGFSSTQEVEAKRNEISTILNGNYIPQGESSEVSRIKNLVERSLDIQAQLEALSKKKLEDLKNYNQKDLLDHKNKLLRKLDDLFTKSLVAVGEKDWPNKLMPFWWPHELKESVQKRESSLFNWREIEKSLSHDIREYLLDKFEAQGEFYPEDFKEIPSGIAENIKKYEELRGLFFNSKKHVLDVFFKLMREGAFQVALNKESGIPDFSKAKDHIHALLGVTNLNPDKNSDNNSQAITFDPESIEGKLRIAEDMHFKFTQEESKLQAELKMIQNEYYMLMSKVDQDSVVNNEQILDVSDYLNMGFDEFQDFLESKTKGEIAAISLALSTAIKDWEEVWKPVVSESQLASPDWYPFFPEYYRAASGLGND